MNVDLIKYPVFSDKSKVLLKKNKYVFLVDISLTKEVIKLLFEQTFNVRVISVNSLVLPCRKRGVGRFIGYKSNYKKVVLTLDKETPLSFLQSL